MKIRSIVLLSFICGCGGSESELDLAESESAIINGTPFSADGSGVVQLNNTNFCSGTLINNKWVLTAAHCGNVVGDSVVMGSQSRTVARVLTHPTSSADAALLELNSPMTMSGSTTSFRRTIRPFTLSAGTIVGCWGYGNNTLGGGAGSLRSASLSIASVVSNIYNFLPNGSGQIQWLGDSGGPCFDSTGAQAGMNRTSTSNGVQVTAADAISSVQFVTWANDIVDGNWYFENLSLSLSAPEATRDLHSFVHNGNRNVVYEQRLTGHIILVERGSVNSVTDLTALTGDTVTGHDPFGYSQGSSKRSVVFSGSDGHIHQYWEQFGVWTRVDVSASAAGTPNGGHPVAYMHNSKQNVFFTNGTGVHALINNAGVWTYQAVSSPIGAPSVGSNLTAYVHGGVEQKVSYCDINNRIIELWNIGSGWNWSNLTLASGAPFASGDPSGYSFGGQQHIIYRAGTGHVIELWGGSSGWTAHDVSATTGAPNADIWPRAFASAALGKQSIVYRVGAGTPSSVYHLGGTTVGNFQTENVSAESGAPTSTMSPTESPTGVWIDSTGVGYIYYRSTSGALFELKTR